MQNGLSVGKNRFGSPRHMGEVMFGTKHLQILSRFASLIIPIFVLLHRQKPLGMHLVKMDTKLILGHNIKADILIVF